MSLSFCSFNMKQQINTNKHDVDNQTPCKVITWTIHDVSAFTIGNTLTETGRGGSCYAVI